MVLFTTTGMYIYDWIKYKHLVYSFKLLLQHFLKHLKVCFFSLVEVLLETGSQDPLTNSVPFLEFTFSTSTHWYMTAKAFMYTFLPINCLKDTYSTYALTYIRRHDTVTRTEAGDSPPFIKTEAAIRPQDVCLTDISVDCSNFFFSIS